MPAGQAGVSSVAHPVSLQMSTTGIACAVLSVYPKFRTPQWRPYRAAMFITMGLSSVWSVFHGVELFGYEQLGRQMGLSWMITEGVLYITGALLYAVREYLAKDGDLDANCVT